jgi:hypothetical protein
MSTPVTSLNRIAMPVAPPSRKHLAEETPLGQYLQVKHQRKFEKFLRQFFS